MDGFGVIGEKGVIINEQELRDLRKRRGECLTCGRKCYTKKLFKMVPITETGRVLEGRCLNCKPLQASEGLQGEVVAASASDIAKVQSQSQHYRSTRSQDGSSARSGLSSSSAPVSSRSAGRPASNRSQLGSVDENGVHATGSSGSADGSVRVGEQSPSGASAIHNIAVGGVAARMLAKDRSLHQQSAPERQTPAPGASGIHNAAVGGVAARMLAKSFRSSREVQATQLETSSQSLGSARSQLSSKRTALPEAAPAVGGSDVQMPLASSGASARTTGSGSVSSADDESSRGRLRGGPASFPFPVLEVPTSTNYASAKSLNDTTDSFQGTLSSKDEDNLVSAAQDPNISFEKLIDIMNKNISSARVQEECFKVLSEMRLSPEDQDAISSLGGLDAIIAAMRAHPDSSIIQSNACRALWNTSASENNQLAIADAGGVEAIVNAMEKFDGVAEVQEKAMAALSNLAAADANQAVISDHGGIQKIVEAMNRHSEDIAVQEKACAALTNLASHDFSLKKAIASAGGCDAVVIGMVMHPRDIDLQEKALRALRNLCANEDKNKALVANVGGIDAVIGAMQVHRNEASIQEAGAWTLSNLAINPDNKAMIGEAGGIDVIIRAMWVHADHVGVQEWACRALWTLSVDPKNKYIIVDVGGISAIVNAMQAHVGEATVQEKGCGVLSNLAANDDNIKTRIVEEEALDAVVMAMVLHGDNKLVQERACTVLRKLAFGPNIKPMQAANVSALMSEAAQKFPDECREKAEYVLAML